MGDDSSSEEQRIDRPVPADEKRAAVAAPLDSVKKLPTVSFFALLDTKKSSTETSRTNSSPNSAEPSEDRTRLALGPCYACRETGRIYRGIYLCSDCIERLKLSLHEKAAPLCRQAGCQTRLCSACMLDTVFRYVSADLLPDFRPSSYDTDRLKIYVQEGSGRAWPVCAKTADLRLVDYLEECLRRFLDWTWRQADVWAPTVEPTVALMKARGDRMKYVSLVLSLTRIHEVIKVRNGYVPYEDLQSSDLRCLVFSAAVAANYLRKLSLSSLQFRLIELLSLFDSGIREVNVDSARATRLTHRYWRMFLRIGSVKDAVVVRELICLGDEYCARARASGLPGSWVKDVIDRWMDGRIAEQPKANWPVDEEEDCRAVAELMDFIRANFFRCHRLAERTLLDHFTLGDARRISSVNGAKLHAFTCIVDATDRLLETHPDHPADLLHLKRKLSTLKDALHASGLGCEKSIQTLRLLLLSDPVAEIHLEYGSSSRLKSVFVQQLSALTKIGARTIRSLLPPGGIRAFLDSEVLCNHRPELALVLGQLLNLAKELKAEFWQAEEF